MIINKHILAPSTTEILTTATSMAEKHGRQFTSTEHALMALCVSPEFIAFIGSKIFFDQERIFTDTEQCVRPNDEPLPGNALRLSPRLTHVLDISADIARELGSTSMEPQHLLLGILKEGNSVTAEVLNMHGVFFDPLLSRLTGGGGDERVEAATVANAS
jgi:ATP-dependent Clp protease ATP-binding subunit ClpC